MMSTLAAALRDLLLMVVILAAGYLLFIGMGEAILKIVDAIKRTRKHRPAPVKPTAPRPVPPPDPQAATLNGAAKSSLRLNLMAQNAYESMAKNSQNSPPL